MKATLFFLSLFILVSCESILEPNKKHDIKYEIGGTSDIAKISFKNEDGLITKQYIEVPWTHHFKAKNDMFLFIDAQSLNKNASLRVTIFKNLNVIVTDDAFGDSVFVSVSKVL